MHGVTDRFEPEPAMMKAVDRPDSLPRKLNVEHKEMQMQISGTHLELMRDPARDFPMVEQSLSIRSARVWHCKYRSLEPLGGLHNLEELAIATFPDDSFEFLRGLEKLRFLQILHMPRVRDLGPLAGLARLTSLSLATLPSWDASRKTTTIESLEPLTAIPVLAHLELFGIRPPDRLLVPLESCRGLRTVRVTHFPQAEVDRFFTKTGIGNEFNPEPGFS
jgi:hypothetical protein